MEALHARYPFLSAAREAVREADVDLVEVVAGGGPVVERGTERVRNAIEEGTVGEPHRTPRVELLSYPVARVVVSLVDEPRLTRRYARAEADTALERFEADRESPDYQSVSAARLTLDALLAELDLDGEIEVRGSTGRGDSPAAAREDAAADARYGIDVATYLELSGGLPGDGWRLVSRSVDDGVVTATEAEFYTLLREAIGERIEAGLPVDVPGDIADALAGPVADVRELLADRTPARDIDAEPRPDLFPPCVDRLLDRAAAGEALEPHSHFSLSTFLASVGMDDDEIAARCAGGDGDEGALRDGIARLREAGGPAVYPPPSCATMQAYGDCEESMMDGLCRRIVHPLDYYRRRLDGEEP